MQTVKYYVSQPINLNDLKGLAAFLLASLEYEKLQLLFGRKKS